MGNNLPLYDLHDLTFIFCLLVQSIGSFLLVTTKTLTIKLRDYQAILTFMPTHIQCHVCTIHQANHGITSPFSFLTTHLGIQQALLENML